MGGGISGLVAAILLKKNGYDPIIYEKKIQCGFGRNNDIEGLETWNFIQNPISFIRSLDIPINFNFKSETQFEVHFDNSPSLMIKDKNPFFHFIKRGSDIGDIDKELQTYALSLGCEIRFNYTPKKEHMSIIATGTNHAKAYIQGYTFKTSLSNQTHLFLNDALSKTGYGYLIIWNGNATLAVAYKKIDDKNKDISNRLVKILEKKVDLKLPKNSKKFSNYGCFDINATKIDKFGKIYIGEAGGFQDYLFGFGMNSAIVSSFLAIKSITENENFIKLINKSIMPQMRASLVNRYLYQNLSERHKYNICRLLSKSKSPLTIIREKSKYSMKKKLFFNIFRKKLDTLKI